MAKLHQWLNTALLLVCAAGVVGLWLETRADLGVQCLEPQEAAAAYFKIDRPGYCIAVAPAHLDRD